MDLHLTDFDHELSGDPNPQYLLKSTAVQMGGVLLYKWEVYCRTNGRRTAIQMGGVLLGFPFKAYNQEGTAIQMGGLLPYKLELYSASSKPTRPNLHSLV